MRRFVGRFVSDVARFHRPLPNPPDVEAREQRRRRLTRTALRLTPREHGEVFGKALQRYLASFRPPQKLEDGAGGDDRQAEEAAAAAEEYARKVSSATPSASMAGRAAGRVIRAMRAALRAFVAGYTDGKRDGHESSWTDEFTAGEQRPPVRYAPPTKKRKPFESS